MDERLGILTPTYDWGLPSIVYEFLGKFELKFISTSVGIAGFHADECADGGALQS